MAGPHPCHPGACGLEKPGCLLSLFFLDRTAVYPKEFPCLLDPNQPPFPLSTIALPVCFHFHFSMQTFEDQSKHLNLKSFLITSLPFGTVLFVSLVSFLEISAVCCLLSYSWSRRLGSAFPTSVLWDSEVTLVTACCFSCIFCSLLFLLFLHVDMTILGL